MNMDECAHMDEDARSMVNSSAVPVPVPVPVPSSSSIPRSTRTRSHSDSGSTPVRLSPSPAIVRATARDDSSLNRFPLSRSSHDVGHNSSKNNNSNSSSTWGNHDPWTRHPAGLQLQMPFGGPLTSDSNVAVAGLGASSGGPGLFLLASTPLGMPQLNPGSGQTSNSSRIGHQARRPSEHHHHRTTLSAPHLPTSISTAANTTETTAALPTQGTADRSSPRLLPPLPPPSFADFDIHRRESIYTSPTNVLPRRSRGLDFSRAATSLHHSIIADRSSPDSSPTVAARRDMAISGRRHGDFGAGATDQSNSLWSVIGGQDRLQSSTPHSQMATDSSDSSDDQDDIMDEDQDEPYLLTPRVGGTTPGPAASPAGSNLLSYQQRRRYKKMPQKRLRGPIGLGFSTAAAGATGMARSPPATHAHGLQGAARRDSLSLQANRLHLSGSESEESLRQGAADGSEGPSTPSRDARNGVIRRAVTRRGNLLPKTKNFARIRAALAEEGSPIESEFRREAEVVRQVRESDIGVDIHHHRRYAPSRPSPNPSPHDPNPPDDVPDMDMMAVDMAPDSSSNSGQPPARAALHPPHRGAATLTPTPASSGSGSDSQNARAPPLPNPLPSAAELTRRINNKRRRDDDLDPIGLKRRAVSPGVSAHNSPVVQSPMQAQRDPWGVPRPGSNGGGDGQRGGAPHNTSGGQGGVRGRVGFQGMVDTSDGMSRMAIE